MENESNLLDVYEIKIRGQLKSKWAGWLNGEVKFQNTDEDPDETTIHLPLPDQAALRGVLNKMWDLNLILISVNLVEGENNDGGKYER